MFSRPMEKYHFNRRASSSSDSACVAHQKKGDHADDERARGASPIRQKTTKFGAD